VDGDETNDDRKDTSASGAYLPSSEPLEEKTTGGGEEKKQKGKAIEIEPTKKERKSRG